MRIAYCVFQDIDHFVCGVSCVNYQRQVEFLGKMYEFSECGNLQLEEFRVMDRRLDTYLDRAYEDVERQHVPLFGRANKVLRHLRRLRVDVAKLTDEVTHITKFFGDWHLARVYLGARDRFYLDQWRASVEQRLAQLDKLYSVVHTELNEQRMLWLEIIIVIFFAIDLLILLWVR